MDGADSARGTRGSEARTSGAEEKEAERTAKKMGRILLPFDRGVMPEFSVRAAPPRRQHFHVVPPAGRPRLFRIARSRQ